MFECLSPWVMVAYLPIILIIAAITYRAGQKSMIKDHDCEKDDHIWGTWSSYKRYTDYDTRSHNYYFEMWEERNCEVCNCLQRRKAQIG